MKTKSVLITLPALLCLASPAVAGDACSHATLDWIRGQLPSAGKPHNPLAESRIVLKQPKGDFCEVVLTYDGNLTPIYIGTDSLVVGQLYSRGIAVTRDTLASLTDAAAAEKNK